MKTPETPSHKALRLKAIEAERRIRQHFLAIITDAQIVFLVSYITGAKRDPTNIELEIAAHVFTIGYNTAVRDMQNRMDLMPYI